MDPPLPPQPEKLEEKDINLVLEQLQDNGFSSFFDHPDCPFSSIQEVDEALKELEKEFLKICSDKGNKPCRSKYKSRASVGQSTSSFIQSRVRNQKKIKDSRKENRFKFVTSVNESKRDKLTKKVDSCPMIEEKSVANSQINREISDHDMNKSSDLASGDKTEVCAIDSSGNKYSLKIEVFATVKLENDENESSLKIQQCQSTPKIKTRKSMNSISPTRKAVNAGVRKEQMDVGREDGQCPPLLLSYRSSMCKPCPSYMNPTALDLKKNVASVKVKPEPCALKPSPDNFKFVKSNLCNKMCNDVNQIINTEKTVGEMTQTNPLQSPEAVYQQDILVNYSLVKDQNNFGFLNSQSNTSKSLKSESRSVQTSLQNVEYNCFDNLKSELNSIDNIPKGETNSCLVGQIKTSVQEQQTSFEVLSTVSKHSTEHDSNMVASAKCDSVDESVNTSALSMFILPKLGADLSVINSDELCLSETFKNETSASDSSTYREDCRVEEELYNSNCNNIANRITVAKHSNSNEHPEKDVIYVDIGVGSDSAILYESEKESGSNPDAVNEVDLNDISAPSVEVIESELYNNSDERITLESSSKETVIAKSSTSTFKERERLTTIEEESAGSTQSEIVEKSSSAVVFDNKVDKNVGNSEEVINFVDKTLTLVDREVDCTSEPPAVIKLDRASSMSEENNKEIPDEIIEVAIDKRFSDKEVWMSNLAVGKCYSQIMVDKEVRTSNVIIKNQSTMVDKEICPIASKKESVNLSPMVDNDIKTLVESKSICTFIDETLITWSDKGIVAGRSEQSIDSTIKTPSSDLSWMVDSSSEQDSSKHLAKKSDQRFGKWSGSRTLFATKFKKSDPKATNSDKVMKNIRDRRERRKPDEDNSKKEFSVKRNKWRQDQIDRDSSCNSASSADQQSRHISGYRKSKELSEYETKFMKGVFSRHGSSGKNKVAMKRRAFSNLDQKIITSRLVKSKKSMGSRKSSKKSVMEYTKSNKRETSYRDNSSSLDTPSITEYKLPDNSVINVEE